MEAYIPLLCLVVITALLWSSVLWRRSSDRSVHRSWRWVGAVALGALGAVAVPVLVAVLLQNL